MIRQKSIFRSEEGVAAIEFALMLPLILLMFYGMLVFSNYNLVSRRIDTTVNDTAFFLSREGQIAYTLDTEGRYTGGREYLEKLSATMIPILMYPFITNDYNYNIKMIGTPFYSATPVDACAENDKIMKVMWSHSGSSTGVPGGTSTALFPTAYSISCENRSFDTGTGAFPYAFSTYHAATEISNAADGVTSYLPGQAFIVMGMSYSYNQGIATGPSYVGNNILNGVQFLTLGIPGMPDQLKRIAAYPIRFKVVRDVNGDGFVTSTELHTELQTCSDCADLNSILNTGSPERTACNPLSTAGHYYGGCNFSIF